MHTPFIKIPQRSLLIHCILFFSIFSGISLVAQTTVKEGVTRVSISDAEIIDIDLRDLPRVPQWKPGDPIVEVPLRGSALGASYVSPMVIDPLLAQQEAAMGGTDPIFANPLISFDGQGPLGSVPPDTVGAVGKDYYIQAINGGGTSWIVYNKSDGTVAAGPFALDNLGTGNCASGAGDPIVLYDNLAGRWLLTEFDSGIDSACVYVSQTGDPISGGWYAYSFDFSQDIDYPKYGIWPDGYYLTSNSGNTADNSIGVFDRVSMLAGAPATNLEILVPDMPGFVLQVLMAGDLDGATEPPTGSPAYLMRNRDDEIHNVGSNDPAQDFIEYYELDVDFVTPGNTLLTGPISVPISEFDSELCGLGLTTCFTQPGGGNQLHSFKEMIMNRLQYRNFGTHEVMLGAFVTDVDNTDHGGVRWFELRKTGANPWGLHQEGTVSLDSDHRWVSGISMDGNGNIALAYNVTGPDLGTFPGIRYIGRKVDAPLGTMPEGEYSVIEGSALSTSGRWGDYAAMSLDPTDDLTFWFTGEYSPGPSFGTRIFSVQFQPCAFPPATNLVATANGDNRIDVSWDAVPGAQNYNVYRALGACPSTSYTLIAEGELGTAYSDTTVSGGSTYSYAVKAFDPVEACLSYYSNCSAENATGICLLPPTFNGVNGVVNPQDTHCALDLNWAVASTSCGTSVVYNIYRSTTSGFTPDLANLVASCVTPATWRDENVEYGVTYYYVVRAEDQTGNGSGACASGYEEDNTVELSGSPSGPNMVAFEDDVESGTSNWTTTAGPLDSGTNPWTVTTTGTAGNGSSWYCQDQSVTKDQRITLVNGISLTTGSLLTFSNKYETESSYDGGVLEYSTDGGSNWQDILAGDGGSVPANSGRFLQGGYSETISSGPIAGRSAWAGNSGGFINTEVDLGEMAGETVHFRWRFSCDTSVSVDGWWIDNFIVFSGSSCETVACVDLLSGLPFWPNRDILFLLSNCLILVP